ncbi:uncharacterized protein LOC143055443 [Mytilus galloprovincialis]|uniref:uncharacterized protein n=1 Tax=Mytilus edulis TaxID=6550 RepID=UPI0039EFE6C0
MAKSRGDWLLVAGLVFSGFALLFLVIGFATPHWLELDTKFITNSGFEKLGLWEACFNNWAYYRDYTGKTYNGCWWIFSYEYRPIWSYINPPWFLGIQVMMTLALLAEISVVLLALLFLIGCCPGRNSVCGLFILGGIGLCSGILTAICTVIFGAKSVVDRQWIENPDKNFLSWSFGCVVFSGFLILFGGMCIIVSALQVRLANQYSHRAKPYAGYEARHEPPYYS